jgi:hypothetical protein
LLLPIGSAQATNKARRRKPRIGGAGAHDGAACRKRQYERQTKRRWNEGGFTIFLAAA